MMTDVEATCASTLGLFLAEPWGRTHLPPTTTRAMDSLRHGLGRGRSRSQPLKEISGRREASRQRSLAGMGREIPATRKIVGTSSMLFSTAGRTPEWWWRPRTIAT